MDYFKTGSAMWLNYRPICISQRNSFMCIYARNKLKAYKSLDVRGQVQDIIFYNYFTIIWNCH